MPAHNAEIAAMLDRLADLLEIEGENPFKVRAYRNAALTVQGLSRSIADMVKAGETLTELPGIGDAIAKKLTEIVQTGHFTKLEQESRHIPATLTDLLKIPSLGPKRVHILFDKLKIKDEQDLESAVQNGKVRELDGFGAKTELKIREYLDMQKTSVRRMPIAEAEQIVTPLAEYLAQVAGVKQVVPAGSYRRRMETVGDLDFLGTCTQAEAAMAAFVAYDEVKEVLARGDTKSSVVLRSGLQVDLRVVPEESFGAALNYFTGSKAHNIALRTRGQKLGLKLNEYGVFKGERAVAGRTEDEVYRSLGLGTIAPELRENRGEIEAAEQGTLPRLVTLKDIRGDLQSHTSATDGKNTLEEMAAAAQARGLEYLAITDHSKRVAMARGLNATRLRQEIKAIDKLNAVLKGFVVLKSIEVDILEDGSLDLSDDVLKDLDIVVAAVHSYFQLSREKQTERIVRAMDNPLVHILAHPTGRIIGERPPYEVDMEQLLRAAKERGCFVELNAHPDRLDLNDVHARMAGELGVKVAISTDAHRAEDFDLMRFGVDQARRAWLTPAAVLNTLPWPDLQKLLRR